MESGEASGKTASEYCALDDGASAHELPLSHSVGDAARIHAADRARRPEQPAHRPSASRREAPRRETASSVVDHWVPLFSSAQRGFWTKLRKRIHYNLRPSRSIEYVACPAFNLGDQAIYRSINQVFAGMAVCYPRDFGGALGVISRWENRRKRTGSMLGGGTIIGAPPWSKGPLIQFEESLKRTGRGFVFGTGVQELIFPPDHEAFVKDPSTYNKWADLLKQCEYVGVRGPRSQMALAELGVKSEVIGDAACALVQPEGFWKPTAGCLGVNVGNGGGSMWGDRDTFNQAMGRFLTLATAQGWKIHFFALMDDDIEMTERIARIAGIADPVIYRDYIDPQPFMARVSKMQAFVGLKLHSVILAMCAHVPSVMLEYRPKGMDFMASVGLEEFNVRTSDVEPSALLELLSKLVDRGPQLSESIRERLEGFRKLQVTRARDVIGLMRNEVQARGTRQRRRWCFPRGNPEGLSTGSECTPHALTSSPATCRPCTPRSG